MYNNPVPNSGSQARGLVVGLPMNHDSTSLASTEYHNDSTGVEMARAVIGWICNKSHIPTSKS